MKRNIVNTLIAITMLATTILEPTVYALPSDEIIDINAIDNIYELSTESKGMENDIEISSDCSENNFSFDWSTSETVGMYNYKPYSNKAVEIYSEASDSISGIDGITYINSAADMLEIRDNLNGSYVLTNDIDLNCDADNQWISIGTVDNPFTGSFDGQGHTISGLYIDNSSDYQGLFGCTKNAKIHDFKLHGSISSKYKYTGSVAGYISGSEIENISSYCKITGFDSIGGIIGYNDSSVISGCKNYSEIVKSWTFHSGTDYSLYGEMSVGGIVGINKGTIYNSENYGTVKISIAADSSSNSFEQKMRLGGIVGYNINGNIQSCKNSGFIYAIAEIDEYHAPLTYYGYIGGIVGSNSGNVTMCDNVGDVNLDWNLSSYETITTLKPVGGIAGYNTGNITGCLNSGEIMGGVNSGGIIGYCDSPSSTLSNCINEAPVRASSRWTGNNYSSLVYAGGIVGNSVSDMSITSCVNYGSVKTNATTVNSSNNTGSYAGGIIGRNRPLNSSTIYKCKNVGNITSVADGGEKSATYSRAGGISGDNRLADIFQSCNEGQIQASATGIASGIYTQSGGIAGLTNSNIYDCYNTGEIISNSKTKSEERSGGIVGYPFNDIGTEGITRCYNVGTISGNISYVIGGNNEYSNVQNCYSLLSDISVNNNTTLLTEAEMKNAHNFTGFDFTSVWESTDNTSYPKLQGISTETGLYKIRFDLNGGYGTCEDQYVPFNGIINKPQTPQRDGYTFIGWYSNEKGSGIPWNFEKNKIRNNITLYAVWKHNEITLTKNDTYSFRNSSSDFFGENNNGTYNISDEYYTLLTQNLSNSEKVTVSNARNAAWDGSCLGIGVSLAFFKTDRMNPSFFSSLDNYKAEYPYDLHSPTENESGTTMSLINYYQLSQFVGPIAEEKSINKSTSTRVKELVDKTISAEEKGSFTLICIGRWEEKRYDIFNTFSMNRVGGHALMGYKVTIDNNGNYRIHLLESNERDNFANSYITVKSDYSAAEFHCAWNSSWNGITTSDGTLIVECTVPIEELDTINLQEKLLNYGTVSEYTSLDTSPIYIQEADDINTFTITTDAQGFTITSDNDVSETNVIGQQIDGDLDVELNSCFGEINSDYLYSVRTSSDKLLLNTYPELYQSQEGTISVSLDDTFIGMISSKDAYSVSISSDGILSYFVDNPTSDVTIKIPDKNDMAIWDNVTITLSSISATIEPTSYGIKITSDNPIGNISATAESQFSDINVESEIEENEVIISIGENNDSIALLCNDQIVCDVPISYSVAFFTGGGTPVKTINNIYKGNLIHQPVEPTKSGYVFDGWYIDPNFSEDSLWDFSTDQITEDTILYAKWNEDLDSFKTIIFRTDNEDQVIVAPIGSEIKSSEYPVVPTKAGCIGKWNASDSLLVEDDQIIYATYEIEESIDYKTDSIKFDNIQIENANLIVNISNQTSYNLNNGTILAAAYKDEQLIGLISKQLPASIANSEFTILFPFSDFTDKYDTVKVFAWSNLEDAQPICKSITYSIK